MAKTITLYIEKRGCVTNGDMIKALFPDIKVYRCNGCAHPSDKTSVLLEHMLSSDWWNSPYKAGDTNADSN